MPRQEAPFFARGRTLADGTTIDASSLEKSANIVGKEWEIEDVHPDTGVRRVLHKSTAGDPAVNHNLVKVRACRNRTGLTIYAKQLVILDPTDPSSIIGICQDEGQVYTYVRPVDEYLPSTGCPDNDVCYVVIEGMATCKLPEGAVTGNVIAAGDWLICATEDVTTQEATAKTSGGRVSSMTRTISASTDVAGNLLAAQVANRIGVCAQSTSKTTNSTGEDLLVNIISV